jgi:tetratricopeptide (TPR) repeat protein/transglutaminase-like putative cysteine protease
MRTKTVSTVVVLVSLCAFQPAHGQAKIPVESVAPPPKSGEALIVESYATHVRFERDGRESRELTARIQVRSEAAVRTLGLLSFTYVRGTETLDVMYVRVRKPDGSVVATPSTDVQDLDSEVNRAAPMYADQREKHIAVKSLATGDTLEYGLRWIVVEPIVPGQFWYAHLFLKDAVVLQEEFAIDLPADFPAKVSATKYTPIISEKGGRKIEVFHNSHPVREPEKKESAWEKQFEKSPTPDIQVSSFGSWQDVGSWYGKLQGPQVKLTPDIRAKAEELTRGLTTEDQKVRAIYDFVSTRFRYISLSLGAGHYVPHAAPDVLANQYGDCKDKHTLLAALLQAVGLKAYAALMSTQYEIDAGFPSPGLFNHLITAIPSGDSYQFIDTTPEVAPFGLLIRPLRDKYALVIPDDGPARLLKTATEPPFPSTQKFTMHGSLDVNGTFEGKAKLESRGDIELLHRMLFRNTPQTEWKDLVQKLSYGMGFGGTVDDVSAGIPDALASPFWFSYTYHRPELGDWENRRVPLPLPPIGLPQIPDEELAAKKPFPLGTPAEIAFEGDMRLPKGYSLIVPAPVNLKEDFAEYSSVYTVEDGVLHGSLHLVMKQPELSAEERGKYPSFAKTVNEDYLRMFSLVAHGTPLPHIPNSEAERLLEQGRAAMMSRDLRSAKYYVERAVELDPKSSNAWMMLGGVRFMDSDTQGALEAYRKAIKVDASNTRAYTVLASTLSSLHRQDEAIAVWKDLLKAQPGNIDAAGFIAATYLDQGEFSEARALFKPAIESNPSNPGLQLQLGQALLNLKEQDQAMAQFKEAMELQPGPDMQNTIAYLLADLNVRLPEARRYAEQAVKTTENESSEVELNSADAMDYRRMSTLAAEWDTLGWVEFRLGNLDSAANYLNASWSLAQYPVIGEHLAEIYEKEGKKQEAVHIYTLSLSALGSHGDPVLREKIIARKNALGGEAKNTTPNGAHPKKGEIVALQNLEANDLTALRTVNVPGIRINPETTKSAEFALAFVKGANVESKYLNGAEELREATKALAGSALHVVFPDDGPTKILRKGILSCSPYTKSCVFVFYPPEISGLRPQAPF